MVVVVRKDEEEDNEQKGKEGNSGKSINLRHIFDLRTFRLDSQPRVIKVIRLEGERQLNLWQDIFSSSVTRLSVS